MVHTSEPRQTLLKSCIKGGRFVVCHFIPDRELADERHQRDHLADVDLLIANPTAAVKRELRESRR